VQVIANGKQPEEIGEDPPRAVERPVMYQMWRNLTFLHWRYAPDALGSLLPCGLQLDTFAGDGWLGVTPFQLAGLRPPGLPALPWLSYFPELNVRTYVIGPDGERGIWFFSLEAGRWLAVAGARILYGLPYRWSSIRIAGKARQFTYAARRQFGAGSARITVCRAEPVSPDALTRFLTARFRLYSTRRGRVIAAQVEHPPWPLEAATLVAVEQNLIEQCGLPAPYGRPLVHFSPGVSVRVGGPEYL
jgi:uncharacterized protein